MTKFIIQGGNRLSGHISISGNKNSILPCLAACLLTDEEITLKNVPKIKDVEVFLEILSELGAFYNYSDNQITIKIEKIQTSILSKELSSRIRASILLVGPLLAREGKVQFNHPGGDVIGQRSIQDHLEGFEQLGYQIERNDRTYLAKGNIKTKEEKMIFLQQASVTATENLILLSVLGERLVTLKNCACEPHIIDLCNLLISMGAKIEGVGTPTLFIKGVTKLHNCTFTIGSDYLEIGTYSIAAALTRGEITMENVSTENLEPVTYHLSKMGIDFEQKGNSLIVSSKKILPVHPPSLHTNIWPGFPSDLMSSAIVLATQAIGCSLMHDWMYESRMFWVDKLISMGANVTIADPHRVLVYGPSKLYGRYLESPDIRAGMAMVLAALIAEGESIINRAELIERGYENVVEKLSSLGANIKQEE